MRKGTVGSGRKICLIFALIQVHLSKLTQLDSWLGDELALDATMADLWVGDTTHPFGFHQWSFPVCRGYSERIFLGVGEVVGFGSPATSPFTAIQAWQATKIRFLKEQVVTHVCSYILNFKVLETASQDIKLCLQEYVREHTLTCAVVMYCVQTRGSETNFIKTLKVHDCQHLSLALNICAYIAKSW